MKTNSEGKWEPKITNNAIDWPDSDRQQVAQILQENITFSGQLGDYVIHGAIEKLLEWRKLYSDQQNKELRAERPFQFSPTNSEREWQVKIVNDYIHPNQEDWQKMNAVCNSLIEIQRLTMEVALLNAERGSVAEHKRLTSENTRLRELLRRAYKENKLSIELQSEISNALNHKP